MQVLAKFLENFHSVDRKISTIFEYPFQKPPVKEYLVPSSKINGHTLEDLSLSPRRWYLAGSQTL